MRSHANCTHPRTPAGRATCRRGSTPGDDSDRQDGHLAIVAERARRLMDEHGLQQWRFTFDNARRRFGFCRHHILTIQISRPLAEVNSWETIRETVLHEIAHALVGPQHGHDGVWRAMAVRVGTSPDRCYDTNDVTPVDGAWLAFCPACGRRATRHRQPKRRWACVNCCRAHAGGKFDERFELVFSRS